MVKNQKIDKSSRKQLPDCLRVFFSAEFKNDIRFPVKINFDPDSGYQLLIFDHSHAEKSVALKSRGFVSLKVVKLSFE